MKFPTRELLVDEQLLIMFGRERERERIHLKMHLKRCVSILKLKRYEKKRSRG